MSKSIYIPDGVVLSLTEDRKLLDARPGRLCVIISAASGTFHVKEQAVGDNQKKGILVVGPYVLKIGNSGKCTFYDGEICAISTIGTPKVSIIEIY